MLPEGVAGTHGRPIQLTPARGVDAGIALNPEPEPIEHRADIGAAERLKYSVGVDQRDVHRLLLVRDVAHQATTAFDDLPPTCPQLVLECTYRTSSGS
jgi:hypothetical protein